MRTTIVLKSRGQTVMLGVLTLLMLALMMMLTFTVNQVVHEKIRIQAHSDAVAYSTAVVEARAFNSTVYSNRAIAAAVVAQMTLHAWMSTASTTAAILMSGAIAFGIIAAEEFAQSICEIPCGCFIHCVHGFQALMIAAQFVSKSMDYGNKVEGMESKFNTAVDSIKTMVDDIHASQKEVLKKAKACIKSVPDKLAQVNAPRATVIDTLYGTNQSAFACALEGSDFDDDCKDPAKASTSDRSIVIENAANAMRPIYDQTILNADAHDDFKSGSKFLKDIQENEGDPNVQKFGSAYTGENMGMLSSNTAESKMVNAMQMVAFTSGQWHDGFGPGGMPAYIYSDSSGGDHFPSWAHSGTHDKFKGVQQQDVCNSENCFINFRADQDPKHDFGQPTAYGAVKYDTLWEKQTAGGRGPNAWIVNDKGTMELQTGGGKSAKVQLIPRKPGFGLSKAKAYFHQIGDWQAPPNFFDPFWRAKLHPFTSRDEISKQASAIGDTDGSNNAAKVPYEGSEKSQQ